MQGICGISCEAFAVARLMQQQHLGAGCCRWASYRVAELRGRGVMGAQSALCGSTLTPWRKGFYSTRVCSAAMPTGLAALR